MDELKKLFDMLQGTIGALPIEHSDARYLIRQIEVIENFVSDNFTIKS